MKILLSTYLFLMMTVLSCHESKPYDMKIPDTKPPLLLFEKGLEEVSSPKVVLEKYIETRMGNAEANKIFDNGDFYKIYLGSSEGLDDDDIAWSKIGRITEKGLDALKKVSEKDLVKYLSGEAQKQIDNPVEEVDWYFYFNDPQYVLTQLRSFHPAPAFVRKVDKILESNFIPDL